MVTLLKVQGELFFLHLIVQTEYLAW